MTLSKIYYGNHLFNIIQGPSDESRIIQMSNR